MSAPAPATPPAVPVYCTPHFVTGAFVPQNSFLSNAEYAVCLDTLVKACNDIMLLNRGRVFLGQRQAYPQKDWWVGAGGRMRPGESVFDACRRLMMREVQLEFSVEELKRRLCTVGSYSFVWRLRDQAPQTNGTADISVVVALELSDEEVDRIKFGPEEYAATKWHDLESIVQPGADFHPALVRATQDWIKQCRHRELDALLLGGEARPVPAHFTPEWMQQSETSVATSAPQLSDAQLLAKVRSYFQYARYISQNDTQSIPCKETL